MCPQNDDSQVCFETLDTAQPTADYLGLPIDTSWHVLFPLYLSEEWILMTIPRSGADENTDDDCVTDLLKKFAKNSTESVLIVWVDT